MNKAQYKDKAEPLTVVCSCRLSCECLVCAQIEDKAQSGVKLHPLYSVKDHIGSQIYVRLAERLGVEG